MKAVEFFNLFNPISFESKQAAQKFNSLELDKKVSVIALTILTVLATFIILGLPAVLVFKVMVDNFHFKQPPPSYTDQRIQRNIPQKIYVPPVSPVNDSKGMELAKRWAFKMIPEVIPMAQMPLQIYKAGTTIKEAVDCYNNGDYSGVMQKTAPLVLGTAALAYGGPVVAAASAAYKAYSLINLVNNTVDHLNEEPIVI